MDVSEMHSPDGKILGNTYEMSLPYQKAAKYLGVSKETPMNNHDF